MQKDRREPVRFRARGTNFYRHANRASYTAIVSKANARHFLKNTPNAVEPRRRNSQWMMPRLSKKGFIVFGQFSFSLKSRKPLKYWQTTHIVVTICKFNDFVRFCCRFSQFNTRFDVCLFFHFFLWQCRTPLTEMNTTKSEV